MARQSINKASKIFRIGVIKLRVVDKETNESFTIFQQIICPDFLFRVDEDNLILSINEQEDLEFLIDVTTKKEN